MAYRAASAILLACLPLLLLGHSSTFVVPRAFESYRATAPAKPWGLQSQGQVLAKTLRLSGAQQPSASATVAPILAILTLLFGASAAVRWVYPPLVKEVLIFRSKGHEILFAIFSACSILWFLAPSYLARSVARPLRPLALRLASQGRTRLSAVTLAAIDFTRYLASAAQAFFAACLVVWAFPKEAKILLPFIPYNVAFITGNGAIRMMGPYFGPGASMGGFMMELIAVLISHKACLLLAALSAFPAYRFVWRALEPSPVREGQGGGAAGVLRELLRTLISGALLVGGTVAAMAAAGRNLPEHAFLPVLVAIAAFSVQPLQNLASRVFAAVHLRSIKKKRLRGFLGGQMVNGSLKGFSGLSAQVDTDDGVLLLPAAAALRLAKRTAPRALGTVKVPAAGVAAGIGAAEAALTKVSKKKKLLAIPLLLALGTVVWRVPSAGPFLYAFALSAYLSAFVLPPPLVLVLSLVILIFGGPTPSLSSKGFAVGLLFSALKQLLAGEPQETLVTCDHLDLEKDEATVAWRTASSVPAKEVAQKVIEAAADDEAGNALREQSKKLRTKAVALSVLAALLTLLACRWPEVVEWITVHAPSVGFRLFVLGMFSGTALRLMNFEIIQQGARRVLPARLAGASGGPGKAAHWFLAVNSRAAAAAAATAFLIPQVGIVQKIAYHIEIAREVAWVDAWVHQISTAFVTLVLSVQGARVLTRSLPQPKGTVAWLAVAVVRAWIVGAASIGISWAILLAVGSPGPASPGVMGGTFGSCLATGIAAGCLALPYLVAKDWLPRLYAGTSKTYWVRTAGEKVVPAQLQGFSGRHARLRPLSSSEELEVPASQLEGSERGSVRPVRLAVPLGAEADAEVIASHLRGALKQQDGILHKPSLEPKVFVADDGQAIYVDAFLEGSAPLDKALQIRSSLLLAAADAVC